MPNTLSGASMTHEEIKDLISSRLTEEVEAREAAMNLEPLNESGDEQKGENGGNGNGGNGMEGFMLVAREGTFQDFLKCKPHNFSRTKGVDSALTWWNSHKRTIGVDVAHAMKWAGLMKLMTEVSGVNFVVDPRVPLILGRPFLRTARALIDVYGEELTLRVDDEAITFKVGQTSRYSYNDAVSINRIDVIDVACEEYAQEVLGFLDSSTSGNPTPSLDPIPFTSSPSLTPFEEGDFILEEIEACLTNDSIPSRIDDDDFDPEGDLLLLEKLLNDDPSSLLPLKELHVEELKIVKSSIDDPPELELKDLPSHLEYAFLEGTDKLPVIIAKNLKEDEKVRLLKVLKSHKRVIAWKIFDIKVIDPQFCTHKILIEDDSKPTIQHQRRVNPKIHEVIKKEVIKLLDARLIYPISDSPWLRDGVYALTPERCALTKKRPPSFALIGRLPTDACLSAYVMLWARSKVKEGIVLGHKISKSGIEVDKVKVDVIAKLPHPTSVKGI
ncbi:hypothetical protein Tco_0834984 [Tanacetum coccineum]